MGHWDWKFGLLSPGKASCDSLATQPTVHAECFSVSIIHRTLAWTTGSLLGSQMLMHAAATWGCMDTVREFALKVDSMRKIPCSTGKWNLFQRCADPTLYQLSYIPIPSRSESKDPTAKPSLATVMLYKCLRLRRLWL